MDIVKQRTQLPTTTDELHKYIIIGKERLKARQAEIRAYDKIDYAENAKAAVKENAQNEADTLLDAEAKLGELLAAIDKTDSKLRGSSQGTTVKKTLPPTITKKESHYAQNEADTLLDAESKLGELLAAIPPKRNKEGSTQGTSLPTLPPTIKPDLHNRGPVFLFF